MNDIFAAKVEAARAEYRKIRYSRPKYIIISESTYDSIKKDITVKRMFDLIDRKLYKGLYIAIDNELEDYEFVIVG